MFVSSTFRDLAEERQAVIQALLTHVASAAPATA
ncbi:MAG: DUF4062 domain-containing protein [Phycisphaerales bacterium]